jgi:hypothetical protein
VGRFGAIQGSQGIARGEIFTLTIMVAGTTPEDERDFGVEGGW